ncbi:DUF1016 N-terminal domain-containing protein [Sabulibacter ruber]|uniref:DUF1016 N-terminal domain-containing protein n=1 Tax=Sabulibacter ruber TaxID=2811901 RepID=UPI001A97322A|nr:DUF1016 N-terminal domain-containing protein [Sabulibacter ruber]
MGKRHLWHCVRVADTFPEDHIVNALSTQLSWTHLRLLAAVEDGLKREFYTELSLQERWSTRLLQERMDSMLFKRFVLPQNGEAHTARAWHLAVFRNSAPICRSMTPIFITMTGMAIPASSKTCQISRRVMEATGGCSLLLAFYQKGQL